MLTCICMVVLLSEVSLVIESIGEVVDARKTLAQRLDASKGMN